VREIWMFEVGDSPQMRVDHVEEPRKAIVELAKYLTKGPSPAKVNVLSGGVGRFIDPELAARVEGAFFGDRLSQCCGRWRRRVDVNDEDPEALDAPETCKACGTASGWEPVAMPLDEFLPRVDAAWKPKVTGVVWCSTSPRPPPS